MYNYAIEMHNYTFIPTDPIPNQSRRKHRDDPYLIRVLIMHKYSFQIIKL